MHRLVHSFQSFGTYLSYRYPGTQNRDFFVFGKRIYLPFGGRVTLVDRDFPDNPPNIDGAVEIEDNEDGTTVDLEEQPHNAVEITPGGPFILRLLHLQDGTIPQNIEVGQTYPAGTYVGDVGNSGTSYVPHLHLALDFIDQVITIRTWKRKPGRHNPYIFIYVYDRTVVFGACRSSGRGTSTATCSRTPPASSTGPTTTRSTDSPSSTTTSGCRIEK